MRCIMPLLTEMLIQDHAHKTVPHIYTPLNELNGGGISCALPLEYDKHMYIYNPGYSHARGSHSM